MPNCRDRRAVAALLVGAMAAAGTGSADIGGTVADAVTAAPVAGARVHLQADPGSPVVLSAADGGFLLPVSPSGVVTVTAGVVYDRSAAANWVTGGTSAADGSVAAAIALIPLPPTDNPTYGSSIPLAGDCGSCHFEQSQMWAPSVHAGSATDAWVIDLQTGTGTPGGFAGYVVVDSHDPGETGFCATCHTPLADVFEPGGVLMDEVVQPGARQGVACLACHQVDAVNGLVDQLHHLGNATYRFPDNTSFPTQQHVWGPLDDVVFAGMRASYAPVFSQSLFCASCHQYANQDTGAPGQTTFAEWLASPWAQPGEGFRACQGCHMPEAGEPGLIASVGSDVIRPAQQRHGHEMVGATQETLSAAIELATQVHQEGDLVRVTSTVTNAGAGHAFPTGVSVRNALLVLQARVGGQPLQQVAGPMVPWWADDEVPGVQDGDWSGAPGTGFARVLEGRINGAGPTVRPVLFIDAEAVASDTTIAAGEAAPVEVVFALPETWAAGDLVTVEARLLYRRAWRALAVTKGWTVTPQGGPIEIEVAATTDILQLAQGGGIPSLGPWGSLVMVVLLALAAVGRLRVRH